MRVIIVGAGEVGFHIAQRLAEEKQDVVLIDKDPQQIRRIAENLDVQAHLGSGTSPSMLKSAGIREADLLVAATDSDEVNLIACLLARNLNPVLVKVARVRNPEYLAEESLLGPDLLGIDRTINPESAMVEAVRSLMVVPGASDVIEFVGGRVKLIGFTLGKDSPFAGRRLVSFREHPDRVLVGAIIRGKQVIIPRGEDRVMAGDLVYVTAVTDDLGKIFRFFGLPEETPHRVIIVGGGQTGAALAAALDQTRINTKIIERDAEKCAALAERLKRVIVIHGDGTDQDLLREENVSGVDFLVALTDDEENNILMSLLAKGLGARKTITRVSKLSYTPLVSTLGIDIVVSPRLAAVRAILQHIRRGKIISVAPLKGERAEAIEAEALETSEIVHKPLARVNFPKGALLAAIVRGEEILIPRGDTVVLPGDHLIIVTLRNVVRRLEKLLTVKLEYF